MFSTLFLILVLSIHVGSKTKSNIFIVARMVAERLSWVDKRLNSSYGNDQTGVNKMLLLIVIINESHANELTNYNCYLLSLSYTSGLLLVNNTILQLLPPLLSQYQTYIHRYMPIVRLIEHLFHFPTPNL